VLMMGIDPEMLLAQKAQMKHGEWKPWVAAHCEFTYDTARIYMRMAEQKADGSVFSGTRDLKRQRAEKRPNTVGWLEGLSEEYGLPLPPLATATGLSVEQVRRVLSELPA